MKIEKLTVGQVVYSVERRGMGNTTRKTTCVYQVFVKEIDPAMQWVLASWNGNPARKFYGKSISKWRAERPLLIHSLVGSSRLATREEVKAAKAAKAAATNDKS